MGNQIPCGSRIGQALLPVMTRKVKQNRELCKVLLSKVKSKRQSFEWVSHWKRSLRADTMTHGNMAPVGNLVYEYNT